ncbi:iron chelate uptake ABC transporter family permease subunit [Pseudogemmobacter sonorensis]|uniref:iron chelate uptake ABC transporter family permease subunit n=1 Tax=Pseudogemmobacter sonorensis TaxID=2989681 RepID=UPI0036B8EEE7
MADSLGFVGLIVPHALRLIVRAEGFARGLSCGMLVGAGLVLVADALPRALFGRDIPVGIALVLVGASAFLWLVHRRLGAEGR